MTEPLYIERLKEVAGGLLAERSDEAGEGEAETRAGRITSARLDDEGLRYYLNGRMGQTGAPA